MRAHTYRSGLNGDFCPVAIGKGMPMARTVDPVSRDLSPAESHLRETWTLDVTAT